MIGLVWDGDGATFLNQQLPSQDTYVTNYVYTSVTVTYHSGVYLEISTDSLCNAYCDSSVNWDEHSLECFCFQKNSSECLLLSNAIIIVFITCIWLYNTLCVDIYALYLVIFEIYLETANHIVMTMLSEKT